MPDRRLRSIALCLAIASLAGCGYTVNGYDAYGEGIENTLKALKQARTQISVGTFTMAPGARGPLICRTSFPIKTPGKETYEQYIKEALVAELQMGGVYVPGAAIRLDGRIDELDFSSDIGTGYWKLQLTATSSNGASVAVKTKYTFSTSFVAESACTQVAYSFEPAVHQLIADLINDPGFAALLK